MPATIEDPTKHSETRNGAVLEAKGLTKRYGRGGNAVEALRGVAVRINDGEVVAIMGPSGCGKTTLLHLLGGIERPNAGEVLIAGEPLPQDERKLAELHRSVVCFVFQGFGLIPSLPARENVEFPLTVAGVPARERHKRALSALRDVDLLDWQNHLPEELSGGQRQRVAIARALVPKPRVILADEPTGNLDTDTGNDILHLLLDTAKRTGSAIVMVTHDQAVADRAGRVLRLRDGLIIENMERTS